MYNFHKKEAPLLGLQGLGGGLGFLAGGGVAERVYSDDVFSTNLWTGSTSVAEIENGIDLSSEGGLVWIKNRTWTDGRSHVLFDTVRGANKPLSTNTNSTQNTLGANGTLSFQTDGFDIPSGDGDMNGNGFGDYTGWTFRKQPGFFDIQTWQGNGTSGRQIAHNLGSVPGFIIIKSYLNGGGTGWMCYHRSLGNTKALRMDSTNAASSYVNSAFWNNTDPTSTHFTLGNHEDVNGDFSSYNRTYIAYIFAHDDQSFGASSNESIIKCDSVTMPSSGYQTTEINLGFEPQFLLIKNTTFSPSNWYVFDNMRGITSSTTANQGYDALLLPNTADDEDASGEYVELTPNGFKLTVGQYGTNQTVAYMAIRRSHKPPTLATKVFNVLNDAGSGSGRTITAGNLVDLQISKSRTNTLTNYDWYWLTRMQGPKHLSSDSLSSENSTQTGSTTFDVMDGMKVAAADGFTNAAPFGGSYIRYFFTRAAGFFDIVCYDGDGNANRNVPHNLGVSAELIIVKKRNGNSNWTVWSDQLSTNHILQFVSNKTSAEISVGTSYVSFSTSTIFRVGSDSDVNTTTNKYIAYLFASLDGISKVGKYNGTGNDVNVDCGFSAGARFVLIKRIDTEISSQTYNTEWYLWDSVRGIVAGNDPYSLIASNTAEVTTTDFVDPLSSGFTVTSSAPDALNANGGSYLYLAIA